MRLFTRHDGDGALLVRRTCQLVLVLLLSRDAGAFTFLASGPGGRQPPLFVPPQQYQDSMMIPPPLYQQSSSAPESITTSSTTTSSTPSSRVVFTFDEQRLIEEMHALSAEKEGGLPQVVQDMLPDLAPSFIIKLRQVANDNNAHSRNASIQSVARALHDMVDDRMQVATRTLQSLLNAGEIRKLDALIAQAAAAGNLDVAFFNVLSLNIKEVAAAAATSNSAPISESGVVVSDEDDQRTPNNRAKILQHIYTRCQEEVEKTIPPGAALLNKLLRTQEAPIRRNIYQHYLTPQNKSITTPSGQTVQLQNRNNAAVLVPLDDFVAAIAHAVTQIRTVEHAGATDRESAAVMVEACRGIAKEARVVIGEAYGTSSPELHTFEMALQPVFRPDAGSSPYIQGVETKTSGRSSQ